MTTTSSAGRSNDGESTSVEFPPPLSTTDRMRRAATFWSSAIPIVASYYGLISRLKLQELLSGGAYKLPPDEEEALWKGLHAAGAEKLADTITHLKGFYVKVSGIVARQVLPRGATGPLSLTVTS